MMQLIIGFALVALTVGMHSIATSIIAFLLRSYAIDFHDRFDTKARPLILGLTAVSLAVKHYLDILLWATVYWGVPGHDDFNSFEVAVYFSSVTYTSLGFGDVVLTNQWRLLCGIEAMNGILLFGWSTAMLFVLVQRFWNSPPDSELSDSGNANVDIE